MYYSFFFILCGEVFLVLEGRKYCENSAKPLYFSYELDEFADIVIRNKNER